jgi:hypothetical protein
MNRAIDRTTPVGETGIFVGLAGSIAFLIVGVIMYTALARIPRPVGGAFFGGYAIGAFTWVFGGLAVIFAAASAM